MTRKPEMRSRMLSRDMKITLVVLACGAVNAINIAKLSPSIEVIRDVFSLSLSSMGLLVALFSALFILTGIMIGAGVKAIGAKKALGGALSLALCGSLLTLLFQTKEALFVGRIIEGIGLITVMLSGPALISQHTSAERRGLLMGIWSGFMPLGNAIALSSASVILLYFSWQAIWITGTVLMIMAIFFSLIVIPADRIAADGKFDFATIRLAISKRNIMVLGTIFALHSTMYQALLQFMPSFSKGIFGLSIFWGSLITAVFCLLSFTSGIMTGQFLQRGIKASTITLYAGTALFALLVVMSISTNLPVIFGLAVVAIGLISGAIPTVCFYLLSREQSDDFRNMPVFTAWMFQIQGFGLFIGPLTFATVVEWSHSWIVGIGTLAFFCLGKIALSFTIKEKKG